LKVSAVIITRNEEAMLPACLESVSWADEIIVVDSGSADRTVEIARMQGAKVIETRDWPGFGAQKNRALDAATHEWVLSIDADERVTPELRDEIRHIVSDGNPMTAYRIPRRSRFCRREMRHSGWWPDYVVRLFRRDAARFSDDLVHERVLVDSAQCGTLKTPLVHEAIRDLEQVLDKVNRYSTAGAAALAGRGRRATLSGAIGHGLWAFIRTYFLRAGFLDGREGFMLAVSNAEGAYYRYTKLMLIGRRGPDAS
jgi:glycosyltransferase involved in cell wall biosynthesis